MTCPSFTCFSICHLMFFHLPPYASPFVTSCFSTLHHMHLHLPPHASAFVTSCFSTFHLMLLHLPPHATVAISCSRCLSPRMHDFFLPINRGRGIHTLFILLHAPTSIIYHNLHRSSISSLIWPMGITTSPSYHQDSK